jgi:hypothetical protein
VCEAVSLCERFPTFRRIVVLSKLREPLTQRQNVKSQKTWIPSMRPSSRIKVSNLKRYRYNSACYITESGVKYPGLALTTLPRLAHKLRMSTALLLLPLCASMACYMVTFTFTLWKNAISNVVLSNSALDDAVNSLRREVFSKWRVVTDQT